MCLFKKKKDLPKKKGNDFHNYKIRINGKTMCAYESLTGRPFLKISTEEDIKHLFYCSLVMNNEEFSTMEYGTFEFLLMDESVVTWLTEEYMKIGAFMGQFKNNIGDEEEEEGEAGKEEDRTFYMLEAISGLIVRMGMDPHYVMYDMEEWEISYYYRMMRDVDRDRLTEERLWTYLQVLPHVGKKLGGPEKLAPFPWEKSNKKIKRDLENNTKAAVAFFAKQNRNGEGRHDNSPEQGGLCETGQDT